MAEDGLATVQLGDGADDGEAELHGGQASLRQSGPRGTVFSLSLPRA